VERGDLSLDAPIAPLVDPMLHAMKKANPAQNFSSCQDLWGKEVSKITVYHLATMQSGIPDFDTAVPNQPPTDFLRQQLFDHAATDFTPPKLLALPWVHKGKLDFEPGKNRSYSSTNFVLLGLVLAHKAGAPYWDEYDQKSFLPKDMQALLSSVRYMARGCPADVGRIHGYDRTTYNNHSQGVADQRDVSDVHGVFSGWSASDYVSTVADAARLCYAVYGLQNQQPPALLSPASQRIMIPTNSFYGFATFNLSDQTGVNGSLGVAYGHIGATYGFDSLLAYHPALDLSIAIASNMELDDQWHPFDTLCLLYNKLRDRYKGTSNVCHYTPRGYYDGFCSCAPAVANS
jgi:CubicO group peptidase (beta-lactamase class C family)